MKCRHNLVNEGTPHSADIPLLKPYELEKQDLIDFRENCPVFIKESICKTLFLNFLKKSSHLPVLVFSPKSDKSEQNTLSKHKKI